MLPAVIPSFQNELHSPVSRGDLGLNKIQIDTAKAVIKFAKWRMKTVSFEEMPRHGFPVFSHHISIDQVIGFHSIRRTDLG